MDVRRRLLIELGAALLSGGLPVNEVEQELCRLGRAMGVPEVRVAALTTGLFVALSADEPTRFEPVGPALRLAQTADVLDVVRALGARELDGPAALAKLDLIRRTPARRPAWVADLGALPVGVGLCLYLQPALPNLVAAAIGSLLVAGLITLARHWPPLQPLLQFSAAFLVSVPILLAADASLLDGPLRTIVPILAILLPGGLLVTGLSEIAAGAASAGTARLVSGTVQLALFLTGVLAAALATGTPAGALANLQVPAVGWWAICLGLALATTGIMINVGTPLPAVPWIVAVVAATMAVQLTVSSTSGAAVGGLAGAVTAAIAASIAHRRPDGPAWQVAYLPAFWILVPGSFGLLNATQLEVASGAHAVGAAAAAVFGVAIGTLIGSAISRIPGPRAELR